MSEPVSGEWQPIETCPYDEVVLFYTSDGNIQQDFWYDAERPNDAYTHWMPLPTPPAQP